MRKLGLVFLMHILIANVSSSVAQVNCYPSHWWTGMKHNTLQVMLHASSDLSKSVKVKYPGVVVTKVFQPENRHYLFVDLLLLPTVKPGKFEFIFDNGTVVGYELKSRQKSTTFAKPRVFVQMI